MKAKLKQLLSQAFIVGQRFKFDVLPRHFYSEIPDINLLRRTQWWRKPYSLKGLSGLSPLQQWHWLENVISAEDRAFINANEIHPDACRENGFVGYGELEAELLYGFLRWSKPKRIIQIGCGVSTAVCLRAFEGQEVEITCVEPYPNDFLKRSEAEGKIKLVGDPVQELDPGFVEVLGENDLFFVDSTHTLGPAGEVSRIILELLPRLREGVYAHFHDIWFPYDYYRHILSKPQFFWHETVLLMAFLTYNSDFEMLCSTSMLHYEKQAELKGLFSHYQPGRHEDGICVEDGHYPSALYLRRHRVS